MQKDTENYLKMRTLVEGDILNDKYKVVLAMKQYKNNSLFNDYVVITELDGFTNLRMIGLNHNAQTINQLTNNYSDPLEENDVPLTATDRNAMVSTYRHYCG